MYPLPCPKHPARVAENGRAFAGSQRWIQYYVNYQSKDLNDAIIRSRGFLRGSKLHWVSPLESDGFAEYRDEMAGLLLTRGLKDILKSLI